MKPKYFFPLHMDSGNRGCEAIALGTKKILNLDAEDYIGLSKDLKSDKMTGLADEVTLMLARQHRNLSPVRQYIFKIVREILITKRQKMQFTYSYIYDPFLKNIDSVTLLTGGDMLCYGNNEVIYINNDLCEKGLPTVLWGCSFGKENNTPEKLETLRKFKLITARESLTYNYLKNDLGFANVYLFPDPAFVLEPKETELPAYFEKDCIGVNLSNFVGADEGPDTVFGKNIQNLLNFIINETDLEIVLIPHVFWKGQDDRIICYRILNDFSESDRIHLLATEHLNYCQIRYAISKCRFFIGARTHAMISAYSMCVPSIALGYSIKSKGIAKDLSMPNYSIVDYRNLQTEVELVDRFKALMQNEDDIRTRMVKIMPDYVKQAYGAKAALEASIGQ